jgi:L-alanine-DL-glutamate epimerase-like enolase superfamily enzyme
MVAVVTTALESAVGRLGALHVAAVLSAREQLAHGLASGSLLASDTAAGPVAIRGRMQVPATPGLGPIPEVEFTPL